MSSLTNEPILPQYNNSKKNILHKIFLADKLREENKNSFLQK